MSEKSSSTGAVIAAFAIGALAGAAVALLFAPASGEETRRRLAERAREGGDYLKRHGQTIASAVERGREAVNQVRKETM
jgi:gas vesicle protein